VIAGLFQEVKKVLSGNIFEEKKQKRRGFEGTMESDNVRVRVQRLMNGDLKRDKGTITAIKATGATRTSSIWAVSASSLRLALERHFIAYSRPYLVDGLRECLPSRSIWPIIDE
jgi:hypothetical protein